MGKEEFALRYRGIEKSGIEIGDNGVRRCGLEFGEMIGDSHLEFGETYPSENQMNGGGNKL